MVWFEYHLESFHGDTIVSPKSPHSPKSPRVIDPTRFVTEDEAIDLYFYIKQVCHDDYYDGCLFNVAEFNSYSIQDLINSRKFNEPIDNPEFYKYVWLPTYRRFIDILHEYINRQMVFMGKRISIPKRLFQRFVYHFCNGFVTQS